jgi:hypothetical protein
MKKPFEVEFTNSDCSFRKAFAYTLGMPKSGNALVIAASLIAAIRIAKQKKSGGWPILRVLCEGWDSMTLFPNS